MGGLGRPSTPQAPCVPPPPPPANPAGGAIWPGCEGQAKSPKKSWVPSAHPSLPGSSSTHWPMHAISALLSLSRRDTEVFSYRTTSGGARGRDQRGGGPGDLSISARGRESRPTLDARSTETCLPADLAQFFCPYQDWAIAAKSNERLSLFLFLFFCCCLSAEKSPRGYCRGGQRVESLSRGVHVGILPEYPSYIIDPEGEARLGWKR